MIELFQSGQQKQEFVSTYQNPFKSDKCKKIQMTIENSFWTNHKLAFKAIVDFQNGDTDGTHRLTAPDFPSLVKMVEEFIKSL